MKTYNKLEQEFIDKCYDFLDRFDITKKDLIKIIKNKVI